MKYIGVYVCIYISNITISKFIYNLNLYTVICVCAKSILLLYLLSYI